MKTVSGLMSGYFSEPTSSLIVEAVSVPIVASKSEWTVLKDTERMYRVFSFKGRPDRLQFFVEELLQFQEKLGHHSKITIEGPDVSIEVYTHGVERITSLDKDLAKEADAIFTDSGEI